MLLRLIKTADLLGEFDVQELLRSIEDEALYGEMNWVLQSQTPEVAEKYLLLMNPRNIPFFSCFIITIE